MAHNVGRSIDKVRDGTIDWSFVGDRLVCLVGGDGFTRIDEKKRTEKGGYRLLMRRFVPSEAAEQIADDFPGKVVWK